MPERGTRGAYRKEDRVQLPTELQKELVEKAASKYGNCQELAKHLNLPKSSVHYYRIGRLTMPTSILDSMLTIADDQGLKARVLSIGITKDRSWATEYAQDVFREICRDRLSLPTREDLEDNACLRRKAAAVVSYILAEGSVWMQKERFGELAANITFANHERDLYEHFRSLCTDVFHYDIGSPQLPGNGACAIRGFVYSRFIAEWLVYNGVPPGDKAANPTHLPKWIVESSDPATWISALQPWLDGEGCVMVNQKGRLRGFSMAQSRHTDLDLAVLPRIRYSREHERVLGRRDMRGLEVFGIPLMNYCAGYFRSVVFDDVFRLLKRLELRPRILLRNMYLKDDGFWSCVWIIILGSADCRKLIDMRLVIQEKKVGAILASKGN
jgi:hypothetical protein